MLLAHSVGLLDGPGLDVEADGLFDKSLPLEVGGRPEGHFLRTGHAQAHDLPVQLIVDGYFNCLRVVLSLSVEMDGFAEHVVLLEVSGQQEAGLGLAVGLTDPHGLLDFILREVESDQVGGRFSLLVELDGLIEISNRLVVLPQPGEQLLVLLSLDVISKFPNFARLHVHPGHLLDVSIGSLVKINGVVESIGGLVEFGCVVVVVLEIDTIVLLGNLYGFVYLAVALADFAV